MIWTLGSIWILIAAVCCGSMALAWGIALRKNFLSLVDAVWAYGIAASALLGAVLGAAPPGRKIVAAGLALLWGGRLGTHLARRLARHFPREDNRYTQLKSQWQGSLRRSSFLFFQFQALSQVLLVFPFVAACMDPSPEWRVSELTGLAVALLGIAGESLADRELRNFSARPENRGHVCQEGLWRYSRHPNYFFEWVSWCGFGLVGVAAPGGGYALLAPAVMLLLLLFVTGVPPAEASSVRSRGAEYARYQATTSKFIPWLPRKNRLTEGGSHVG